MSKREFGFLIIGVGLGLLLSEAVTLEVMLSLRDGSKLTAFGFDKVVFIIPVILLVIGVILVAYRSKAERLSARELTK